MLALALSVLLPCLLPAGQDDGFYRELHPDGSLHLEVEVKRGKDGAEAWDGRCRELAPDGAVLAEGRFKDGRAQGKWTFRFPNGKTRARGAFEDGRGEREWQLRRDTGQRWAEGTLAGGELSGPWTFYGEDEQVDPVHSGAYSAGEDRWPSGLLRARGALLDGAPHGPWEGWWEDGSLREAGFFVRGERIGAWRFFHRDGTADDGLFGSSAAPPAWPAPPLPPAPQGLAAAEARPPAAGALPILVGTEEADLLGLVQRLRSPYADARAPWRSEVTTLGTRAVPCLIDALGACDLGSSASEARARVIQEFLVAACRGRGFGWTPGAGTEAAAANRARVRAWHSLWTLTADDPVLWYVRCALPVGKDAVLFDLDQLTSRVAGPAPASPPYAPGADPELEVAIERALAWLALHQEPDGRFAPDSFTKRCTSRGAAPCGGPGEERQVIGVTGLATLAFLRAGHGLDRGPHSAEVARAVGWLLRQELPTGLFGERASLEHMYSHLIATWAMSEALARAPDGLAGELRAPAQRAVTIVERARNRGPSAGWRYEFEPNGEADTSITGWALHALCAARAAGLDVEQESFACALAHVDAFTAENGRVGYNTRGSPSSRNADVLERFPWADAGEPLTAVGVLIRLAVARETGEGPDAAVLAKHAALLEHGPRWDPERGRDPYAWFWEAQATRALGGDLWKLWRTDLRRELLRHQEQAPELAGSWPEASPWAYAGGRVYATALYALCLIEAAQ